MTDPTLRLLSVIAPCRNEAAFIDAFCDSVLRQQLPEGWRMEVLIADGLSDDGTRARLQERCAPKCRRWDWRPAWHFMAAWTMRAWPPCWHAARSR